MSPEFRGDLRLSDDAARRVLVRAAELDGTRASEVTVTQLRQIAVESGIAPEAFDAALREAGVVTSGEAGRSARGRAVPLWVRFCMFGVPDRRAATVFYWLFGAAMVVWPFRMLVESPVIGEPSALGTAAGMGFCGFALWSTSRAIRWLDRHGWKSLP